MSYASRYLYPEVHGSMPFFMPVISTKHLPSETASHIKDAYHEVKSGPRIGIYEERHDGELPIMIDKKPPYAGVTEMRPVVTKDGIDIAATRMGINDSLPTYGTLPNGRRYNVKKRVGKHESMHVLSEKLTKYLDVHDHHKTLIMESYAEFGGMKARPHEKDEIVLTSPYPEAIKFGLYVERFYESRFKDRARGYAAFIRDIQRYKSARLTMMNLSYNIKEAVNRGMDVRREIDSLYKGEVEDSLKKAA